MLSLTGITVIDFIATKCLEYRHHKKSQLLNDDKMIINEHQIMNSEESTEHMSKHKKLFFYFW